MSYLRINFTIYLALLQGRILDVLDVLLFHLSLVVLSNLFHFQDENLLPVKVFFSVLVAQICHFQIPHLSKQKSSLLDLLQPFDILLSILHFRMDHQITQRTYSAYLHVKISSSVPYLPSP